MEAAPVPGPSASAPGSKESDSKATGTKVPGRKRALTAYKFYMKAIIKELKGRFPGQTIVLPMVSKLCAQTWSHLDEDMKKIFQIEADQCEKDRIARGLDDYEIPDIPSDLDSSDSDAEEGDEEEPVVKQKDNEKSHGNGVSDIGKEPVQLGQPVKKTAIRLEPIEEDEDEAVVEPVDLRKCHDNELSDQAKEPVTLKTKKAAVQPEPIQDEDAPQVVAVLSKKPKAQKQKRPKAKPLPGAPRRPLSAFVWYCKDERPKVRKSNPGLTMGDASKLLGKMWHALEPELKDIYQNKSKEDRQRYNNEMEAFKATLTSESESTPQQESAEAETDKVTSSDCDGIDLAINFDEINNEL